jgi:hypothetical protein
MESIAKIMGCLKNDEAESTNKIEVEETAK